MRESEYALSGPSNLFGRIGVRGKYSAQAVRDSAAVITST
jgi:hypothetical protein